mgnify:CR=1 FL=1
MIKKRNRIAILLPYKEIYSTNFSGAASIWVKDYLRKSSLSDKTIVYGYLKNKLSPLTKNFKNLLIKKTFFSKSKKYAENFLNQCNENNFDIIEIHNRAETLNYLIENNIKSKLIFVFHNNPQEIRGSKLVSQRMKILENTDKIFFVSKWTCDKFFEGLPFNSRNNCEIVYPSIDPIKKFNPNKKKQIIFAGKLNSSKGYDLFGATVIKILNKYPDWNAVVVGNEPREKFNFKHRRLKVYPWLPHKSVLKLYNESSISVVPSKWEEPFGRTAMESAAYGCATITSNRGGLPETFDNNLMLDNLTIKNLLEMISNLIRDKKKLTYHQKKNFENVIHKLDKQVEFIDSIKFNLDKKVNLIRSLGPKILHISNFNEKNNHRLFNISIASKLTSGFVRNNCDVINFSYRNFSNKKIFSGVDSAIIDISKNYRPDMILLGHNNILTRNTLEKINSNKIKVSLWYEDHVAYKGPNWKNNLSLLEKNNDLIDNYFITTHPDVVKSRINKKKLFFMPIPVDRNIETLDIYKNKYRYKDLFFALSHGVNYGSLRSSSRDERETFIKKLQNIGKNIKFHFLGLNFEEPKWNFDFYKEMMICKMSLNLSRGTPLKYATSNRLASYMGNGILTFIDKKTKYENFFNKSEMCFYENVSDLKDQILDLKDNDEKINRIAKNGKKKYFKIFNNNIVSNYILHKTLNFEKKFNYVWD